MMNSESENREKTTCFRLPIETYEALREIAEREDRSVSYVLRQAVEAYLAERRVA